MKDIYIILLCPFLFACHSVEKSYNLCGEFNETINVNGKLFVDSIVTNYPSAIECDDSNLIIFSEGKDFINVYDVKNGKKLGSAGAKGRSTGEVISACFSGFCKKDSLISIYDATTKKINYYVYSECDTAVVKYTDSKINEYSDHAFSRLHCMDNGYKIGYSIFDSQDLLVLFDKEFKFITKFGDFPLKDIEKFKGTIPAYIASNGNYIAYATIDFGYIALYKISNNGNIVKEWDKYMTSPIYDFNTKNGKVTYNDGNLDGFMNIKMTNKYIYCIYSGKTYDEMIPSKENITHNEILVFDYKGTPIKKIIPNYPMFYFDISNDDKYIYSYVEDEIGKIIKYTI